MRRFQDREEAGRLLGEALRERGYRGAALLGIPRGGVIVAAFAAPVVEGDVGIIVARKLRAPFEPELAIGAVTAEGEAWVDRRTAAATNAGEDYIRDEIALQVAEARRRMASYDGNQRPNLAGRTAVIVDDGIATGATALAAIHSVRAAGAARVVLAVPVGPVETLRVMRDDADDVVALIESNDFWAVGQFYEDFEPVDDEAVRRALQVPGPGSRADADATR